MAKAHYHSIVKMEFQKSREGKEMLAPPVGSQPLPR
jgi:hypothetical protein